MRSRQTQRQEQGLEPLQLLRQLVGSSALCIWELSFVLHLEAGSDIRLYGVSSGCDIVCLGFKGVIVLSCCFCHRCWLLLCGLCGFLLVGSDLRVVMHMVAMC